MGQLIDKAEDILDFALGYLDAPFEKVDRKDKKPKGDWIKDAEVLTQLDESLKAQKVQEKEERKAEVKEAKVASGLHEVEWSEALEVIDRELDRATDFTTLKVAFRQICIKMLPHIIDRGDD